MDTAIYVARALIVLLSLLSLRTIAKAECRGILAVFMYLNILSIQPLDRLINQAEI